MKIRLLIVIGIIATVSVLVTGVYFSTEQVSQQDHYVSSFYEEHKHEFQNSYHVVITGKVVDWHGPEGHGSDWYEPAWYEPEPSSKYYYQYDVKPLALHTPRTEEADIYKIFGDKENFIPVNADIVLFGLDKDDEGLLYIVKTIIREKPQP